MKRKFKNTNDYLDDLSNDNGHLNLNPFKKTEIHPDYTGFIKIENKIYKIAGWVKIRKDGQKNLALKTMDYETYIAASEL
jgi:hypothetical protein